jgi:hypothetical protein
MDFSLAVEHQSNTGVEHGTPPHFVGQRLQPGTRARLMQAPHVQLLTTVTLHCPEANMQTGLLWISTFLPDVHTTLQRQASCNLTLRSVRGGSPISSCHTGFEAPFQLCAPSILFFVNVDVD